MNTKTLEDLEFPIVLSHLSDLCLTELGKKYAYVSSLSTIRKAYYWH